MDFAEPGENEILEELTSNSSSTDHQDPRLAPGVEISFCLLSGVRQTNLFDAAIKCTQRLFWVTVTTHDSDECSCRDEGGEASEQ